MEFFDIITNIGLILVIVLFFYFLYTISVIATKQTVNYIKAKCPDYWTYDDSDGTCAKDGETIILSDFVSDCDKYSYTKTENIPWSGISNNSSFKEKCKVD